MAKEKKKKEIKPRELTEKEKLRTAEVEEILRSYESEGYERRALILDVKKESGKMLLAGIIPCILPAILFVIRADFTGIDDYLKVVWISCIVFLIGIPVHEGIHGLFWGIKAEKHFKSIAFGAILSQGLFYCTSKEPLPKKWYIMGAIAPGIILGILPMLIGGIMGNFFLTFAGFLLVTAASGDFMIIWHMLRYDARGKDVIFIDHPTEPGMYVLEKNNR